MANPVFLPKRSNTQLSVPTTSNLTDGEIAVNSADKKIYIRNGSEIIAVANYSENFWLTNVDGTYTLENVGIGVVPNPSYILNIVGDVNLNGSLNGSSFESYELDDISLMTDGLKNEFPLTFNYESVDIFNPFNLMVFINGIIQSAFILTSEDSLVLGSRSGYTVTSEGKIKFSESIPQGTSILIRVIPSSTTQTKVRNYPFSPLNILFDS